MNRYATFLFAGVVCLGVSSVTWGNDSLTATQIDLILDSVKFERDQLKSGEFIARGVTEARGVRGNQVIRCFFDFSRDRLYFDQRGEAQKLTPPDTWIEGRRISCLGEERNYHFSNLMVNAGLFITGPKVLSGEELVVTDGRRVSLGGIEGHFDIRALGFLLGDELNKGWSFEHAFKKYKSGDGDSHSGLYGVKESASVVRIWTYYSNLYRDTLWIDTARGHVIFKRAIDIGRVSSDFNSFEPIVDPEFEGFEHKFTVDIGWAEKNGVYYPTSYLSKSAWMTGRDLSKPPSRTNAIQKRTESMLSFEWKSVNQEIDADRFEYSNFELPKNTVVYDLRGMKPTFVELTGGARPK